MQCCYVDIKQTNKCGGDAGREEREALQVEAFYPMDPIDQAGAPNPAGCSNQRDRYTLVQPNSGNRLSMGCLTGSWAVSLVCLKVGRFTTFNVMETWTKANFPTGIDSFDLSQVGLAD